MLLVICINGEIVVILLTYRPISVLSVFFQNCWENNVQSLNFIDKHNDNDIDNEFILLT